MLNQSYEKRFEKWETKKRATMGDVAFKLKYIKIFRLNVKKKPHSLISTGMFCSLSVLYFFNWFHSNKGFLLMMAILWGINGLIWALKAYRVTGCRGKFIKQKIKDWEQELAKIDLPPMLKDGL
jgi:hypothetical protein